MKQPFKNLVCGNLRQVRCFLNDQFLLRDLLLELRILEGELLEFVLPLGVIVGTICANSRCATFAPKFFTHTALNRFVSSRGLCMAQRA